MPAHPGIHTTSYFYHYIGSAQSPLSAHLVGQQQFCLEIPTLKKEENTTNHNR
jgi:hypothetical protein|tara:strand:- start:364 stop:522 length:159 start_codon:yes stop_codon:yes gene_type:complete